MSKVCDSLANLDLLIHKTSQTALYEVSSKNLPGQPGVKLMTKVESIAIPLSNQFGCDSILILNLNILQSQLRSSPYRSL
ncbi:MAG: hypothetical protein IPM92_16585 [Saprospiraceae bacterium]|nr:hypothetical protein [Saprospiraceae bacterium]